MYKCQGFRKNSYLFMEKCLRRTLRSYEYFAIVEVHYFFIKLLNFTVSQLLVAEYFFVIIGFR